MLCLVKTKLISTGIRKQEVYTLLQFLKTFLQYIIFSFKKRGLNLFIICVQRCWHCVAFVYSYLPGLTILSQRLMILCNKWLRDAYYHRWLVIKQLLRWNEVFPSTFVVRYFVELCLVGLHSRQWIVAVWDCRLVLSNKFNLCRWYKRCHFEN